MSEKKQKEKRAVRVGKECAYLAVFVAILIASQLCLAALPAVEVVSVLFFSYCFVFGAKRGMIAATAFSLLRQLVFLFYPSVFLTYLVYYNLVALLFGWLGRVVKRPLVALWWLTVVACLCTFAFSLLDCIVTPLWYGFTWEATKGYFFGSLPVTLPQIICTGVTVALLFIPLQRAFGFIQRKL